MKQNTQEWLDFRKGKIGASDAPIIMGVSPYKTPYQLWEEKMGMSSQEVHAGMQHGIEMEPVALNELEDVVFCRLQPKVVIHPKHLWMIASLDAINVEQKIVAEIKNPCQEDHDIAKRGTVPEKYFPQVQHQLEIVFELFGIKQLYYFSYRNGDKAVVKVDRDADYIADMIEKEKEFFKFIESKTPPPFCNRDYRSVKDDSAIETATELADVMKLKKDLEKREAELRCKLISYGDGNNFICGPLKLTQFTSSRIDYKSIPQLKEIDLDKYRKESSPSWRCSIVKGN